MLQDLEVRLKHVEQTMGHYAASKKHYAMEDDLLTLYGTYGIYNKAQREALEKLRVNYFQQRHNLSYVDAAVDIGHAVNLKQKLADSSRYLREDVRMKFPPRKVPHELYNFTAPFDPALHPISLQEFVEGRKEVIRIGAQNWPPSAYGIPHSNRSARQSNSSSTDADVHQPPRQEDAGGRGLEDVPEEGEGAEEEESSPSEDEEEAPPQHGRKEKGARFEGGDSFSRGEKEKRPRFERDGSFFFDDTDNLESGEEDAGNAEEHMEAWPQPPAPRSWVEVAQKVACVSTSTLNEQAEELRLLLSLNSLVDMDAKTTFEYVEANKMLLDRRIAAGMAGTDRERIVRQLRIFPVFDDPDGPFPLNRSLRARRSATGGPGSSKRRPPTAAPRQGGMPTPTPKPRTPHGKGKPAPSQDSDDPFTKMANLFYESLSQARGRLQDDQEDKEKEQKGQCKPPKLEAVDGDKWRNYRHDFELCAEIHKWKTPMARMQAMKGLRGRARDAVCAVTAISQHRPQDKQWYIGKHGEDIYDVPPLKMLLDQMESVFISKSTIAFHLKQLSHVKQANNESAHAFFSRFRPAYRLAHPNWVALEGIKDKDGREFRFDSCPEFIRSFINGLHTKVAERVREFNPQTIEDAIQRASDLESAHYVNREQSRPSAAPRNPYGTSAGVSEIVRQEGACDICKSPDHLGRNCQFYKNSKEYDARRSNSRGRGRGGGGNSAQRGRPQRGGRGRYAGNKRPHADSSGGAAAKKRTTKSISEVGAKEIKRDPSPSSSSDSSASSSAGNDTGLRK